MWNSVDKLGLNRRGLPDPSWIQQTHQHKFGPYSYNLLLIREILSTFESVDPRGWFRNFTYPWRLSPQGLDHSIALDVSSIPIFTQRLYYCISGYVFIFCLAINTFRYDTIEWYVRLKIKFNQDYVEPFLEWENIFFQESLP